MDGLLAFFADLILFTAGLAVCVLWILVAIEGYDLAVGIFSKKEEEDEDV